MGNQRMVEIVHQYGSDRIIVDSSADWGISDPLAVPKTAQLMLQSKKITTNMIHATCYQNALDAYSRSGQINEDDWKNTSINQMEIFEGNSVLRGQQAIIE